jgi:hypothetical protein
MSDLGRVGYRIAIFVAFVTAAIFIVAALVGYDFLGDRNAVYSPTWTTAPVWSELLFGVIALAYGLFAVSRLRNNPD